MSFILGEGDDIIRKGQGPYDLETRKQEHLVKTHKNFKCHKMQLKDLKKSQDQRHKHLSAQKHTYKDHFN